jgi:hypothetical protein
MARRVPEVSAANPQSIRQPAATSMFRLAGMSGDLAAVDA